MRRILLAGILLAGVGGGALLYARRSQPSANDAPTDVHVVAVGAVELTLKETGVVEPRQSVAVKSKVSGRIARMSVAEGDFVRAGQLVAVVEPDTAASLTLSRNRMELRRLKIDLDRKERELRRQRRLASEGLAAAQANEEAESDFATARNQFEQAKTALNLLEREANQKETSDDLAVEPDDVTEYRILAPIDGIVATIKLKVGELATSGTTGFSQEGALLMEIADQRQLEVVVNVNEIDVPRVKPGMPAKIQLAAKPGQTLPGVVDRVAVAPVTDDNKLIVFPIHIALPERPPELRQGMSASVDLTLESVAAAIRIPVLAFVDRDGKTFVRVQTAPGQFEDRAIEIGLRSDRFVEVKSGLAEKDVIAARYPRKES